MLQNLVSTEATFCKDENESRRCSSTLMHSAGKVVNSMNLPHCWEWTLKEVSEWLERDVELPQYKLAMEVNFINGRRLCLLEAHKLLKMGIHDFGHIKTIMEAIRKLFNIEKVKFKRSISLPIKYPMTLYLEYRVPTGPIREETTPTNFFKKCSIINNEDDCRYRNNSKSSKSEFPIVRFGGVKRKSVYTRIEFNRPSTTVNVHRKFIDFLLQLHT
ncbi:sterile alpha motif domain-containing protein 15 [Diachasmimorpha longicaudata]|uniref:sterile alpha motif domain-containing protein 15 n=1 Tax=Diachasmimorpha longicaudata TaxID=58733 RepID=UPI0030B8F25A